MGALRPDRRLFLKRGAIALLALGVPPRFLARALAVETGAAERRRTLVCVFQRGAVDGLNMIVPFGEPAYYAARRSIAVAAPSARDAGSAIDLDGFFGLHPELAPLLPLWREGELAVVHACGSPHPTRSHFEAQDYMETATPGAARRDGWLNRVLAARAAHAADHATGQARLADGPALRGVAIGPDLPLSLRGPSPALAIPDLASFGLADAREGGLVSLESSLAGLYRAAGTDALGASGAETFAAVERLARIDLARYRPRPGVTYEGDFGGALRQVAQLVKADVGLEVAFVEIDGWDTHLAQGGAHGRMALQLRTLARGLRAFHDDLGDRMEDVLVLTMSEFGRTVAENGSGGTDHGHGNCMLAFGGRVGGGRVLGSWPGLDPDALHERRDLAVTTDFRDVFAEIVVRHLKAERPALVFPGHPVEPARFPALLG